MPGTNYDATDWDCVVAGGALDAFMGASNFRRVKETGNIVGVANRVHGKNRQRGANGATITIRVDRSSTDVGRLDALVVSQNAFVLQLAVVRNLADYKDGQEVGLTITDCTLMGGERGYADTDTSEAVEYAIEGVVDPISGGHEIKGVSA